MKKRVFWAIIFLAPLVMASTGYDAKISWSLPTSYADGTPIDPADVRKISVMVFMGPAKTGPWKWIATSSPGATSVAVVVPSTGQTNWFTVASTLDGRESEYSVPVSKANLAKSITAIAKKVAEKMFTVKKMIFLFFLILLIGLIWGIWYSRKRVKG